MSHSCELKPLLCDTDRIEVRTPQCRKAQRVVGKTVTPLKCTDNLLVCSVEPTSCLTAAQLFQKPIPYLDAAITETAQLLTCDQDLVHFQPPRFESLSVSTLDVDTLTAEKITAMSMCASSATIDDLDASAAMITDLDASAIHFTTLSGSSAVIDVLNVPLLTTTLLASDSIVTGFLDLGTDPTSIDTSQPGIATIINNTNIALLNQLGSTTASGNSAGEAVQTSFALYTQLRQSLLNLQTEFSIFRSSILSLVGDTPITRSFVIRAQPDVISIQRRFQPEYKLQIEQTWFIEITLQDWQPITPTFLGSGGSFALPYDTDETYTQLRLESQVIPGAVTIPVFYGNYSGTPADFTSLSLTTSNEDLILAGSLTGLVEVSPLNARCRRVTGNLSPTAITAVGSDFLDLNWYSDDDNLTQTLVSIGQSVVTGVSYASAGAGAIAIGSWNGASYDTELSNSVLSNLSENFDPQALLLALGRENASGPPLVGSGKQLQGAITEESFIGYNFAQVTKGDTSTTDGFLSPNYGAPAFPSVGLPPFGPSIFATQWSQEIGWESFVDFGATDFQSNGRWRMAASVTTIDWNTAYLGINWGENSVPGYAVYDTVITFNRNAIPRDGGQSVTGLNYVSIGGRPYALFSGTSWIERADAISFGFT